MAQMKFHVSIPCLCQQSNLFAIYTDIMSQNALTLIQLLARTIRVLINLFLKLLFIIGLFCLIWYYLNPQIQNINSMDQTHRRQINRIQRQIFQHVGLSSAYSINEININQTEVLKTIFIKSKIKTERVLYLGHGLQGTSLMYFPLLNSLLQNSNIVLWQIRGMGLATKIQYPNLEQSQIEDFYLQGIQQILNHYNHRAIVFISHSFSAYLTMKFVMKYGKNYNIQQCILLSPIGITAREKDYKNQINSVSDVYHQVKSWLGWNFQITKKSLMRYMGSTLRQKVLIRSFGDYQFLARQLQLLVDLFSVLSNIPGGSERYFFRIIQPRVLPKKMQSIQELIQNFSSNFSVKFFYGGRKDWVDKQGAYSISKEVQNFSIKILQNCGHLLPLHIKQLQNALKQQLYK